ncbi:MAG: protealysin inhibitor emfourin [Mycetocola sp.]
MKVTVTRSGGFAGLSRRWQVLIEREPDEEAWLGLLSTLPWDEVPRDAPQPDRYLYRINCEPDDGVSPEPREAVIPEQDLTGAWRELVDRVRERDEQERDRRPSHPSSPEGTGG